MLEHMIGRVRLSRKLDAVWVATTVNPADDPVAALCRRLGVEVFRGDEHDVLGRYRDAAEKAGADPVVRLTADCPLIDPALIDRVLSMFLDGGYDYVSNAVKRTYPDGLDVEVFSRAALERAHREATQPAQREHVTLYLQTAGRFNVGHVCYDADFSHIRWTVDAEADLDVVRRLVAGLPAGFGWQQALALATRFPDLLGVPPGSGQRRPA